ncbi:MAG: phospholipid/cholesterol/gamma-HCH transport system substrate-binding protein [Bacteroidia bacterium]
MKHQKEISTAIIALCTILGVVWGYNFLKGTNMFDKQVSLYTVYDDIDGLTESSAVVVSGFKVGIVKDIFFKDQSSGQLVVELVMTEDNVLVTKTTQAKLVSSDFFGTKAIELILDNGVPIEPNDTLPSLIEGTLTEELTNVSKSLIPLKVKAENMIQTLDTLLMDFRDLVGDGNRPSSLNSAFKDLAVTMDNLKSLTGKVDNIVDEDGSLGRILEDVEGFTSVLEKNQDELDNLLGNLSSFSDTLVAADLAATIDNANKTFAELTIVLERVNAGEGSIGKLMKDEAVYDNLEKATADLDSLLLDMKARPGRYIHFSVFGKKDKDGKTKKK